MPDLASAENERAHRDSASSLSHYIARVQAIQPLTREHEYELACRVRDHDDRDAARQLIEANLRYVVAIALSYRRYGVRLADLVSEGNVGLMISLKKFDPSRGTRFVTYAAHWIRAYVLNHVIRAWSIVGVGARAAAVQGVLPTAARESEDPRVDQRPHRGQREARRALRDNAEKINDPGASARGARCLARREGVRRWRRHRARHSAGRRPLSGGTVPRARTHQEHADVGTARRSRSSTRANGSSSRCG